MSTPTAGPLDAVAALLRQDFGGYEQIAAQADPNDLGRAVSIAFFLAAGDLFENRSVNDIIEFVARARQRYDDTGDNIDPGTAERLLRAAAFDQEELVEGLDTKGLPRLEVVLLGAMVYEANWDEAQLDEFIADARTVMAEQ